MGVILYQVHYKNSRENWYLVEQKLSEGEFDFQRGGLSSEIFQVIFFHLKTIWKTNKLLRGIFISTFHFVINLIVGPSKHVKNYFWDTSGLKKKYCSIKIGPIRSRIHWESKWKLHETFSSNLLLKVLKWKLHLRSHIEKKHM